MVGMLVYVAAGIVVRSSSKVCESAVMALALAPVPLAPRHHCRVLAVSTLVLASAGVRQSTPLRKTVDSLNLFCDCLTTCSKLR